MVKGGEGKLKINSHEGLKLYCHKSKIEFRLNKADEEPFLCLVPIDFAALMSQGTRDTGRRDAGRGAVKAERMPNAFSQSFNYTRS